MIERHHPQLSIGKQCRLLSISRSSFYYTPKGESGQNLTLMRLIDEQFLETPFYGVRQMTWHLRNEGHLVNEKRIHRFGPPEIMNTDQGRQFTSFLWTDRVKRAGIKISMDGKGRFLDNIFVERLWRSLKYECVYLHAWESGSQAKAGIRKWMEFYNRKRPHSALAGKPPAVVYWQKIETTNPDQQEKKVA